MEDKIEQSISKLPDADFPPDLHGRIMMTLFVRKLQVPFTAMISIVTFNLGLSLWSAWQKIVETEVMVDLALMLEGFEWNLTFINGFATVASQSLPVTLLTTSIVNLFLLAFLILFFQNWKTYKGRLITS